MNVRYILLGVGLLLHWSRGHYFSALWKHFLIIFDIYCLELASYYIGEKSTILVFFESTLLLLLFLNKCSTWIMFCSFPCFCYDLRIHEEVLNYFLIFYFPWTENCSQIEEPNRLILNIFFAFWIQLKLFHWVDNFKYINCSLNPFEIIALNG